MTFYAQYWELQRQFETKYGQDTVVLMQKGNFYEIYEWDPSKENIILNNLDGLASTIFLSNIKETKEKIGKAIEIGRIFGSVVTSDDKSKKHGEKNPFMVGFPCVSYEYHRDLLLANGFTVIKVDEVGEVPGKKLKVREVVDIVSPGTNIDSQLKNQVTGSDRIISIYIEYQKGKSVLDKTIITCGFASIDITTGKTIVTEAYSKPNDQIHASHEIYRFLSFTKPSEILLILNGFPKDQVNDYYKELEELLELQKYCVVLNLDKPDPQFFKPEYQEEFFRKIFNNDQQKEKIIKQPGAIGVYNTIEQLNLERLNLGRVSYIYLLQHCYEHKPALIKHLQKPETGWSEENQFLILTHNAIDQLDILPPNAGSFFGKRAKKSQNNFDSLVSVLDETHTEMGSRFLREKLVNPILSPETLETFYLMTQELVDRPELINSLGQKLSSLPDIEKLHRFIQLGHIKPKDFSCLVRSYYIVLDIYIEIYNLAQKEGIVGLKSLLLEDQISQEFNEVFNSILTTFNLDKLEKVVWQTKSKNINLQTAESFVLAGASENIDLVDNQLVQYKNWLDNIATYLNGFITGARSKKIEIQTDRKGKSDAEEDSKINVMLTTSKASGEVLKRAAISEEYCGKIKISEWKSNVVIVTSDQIKACTVGVQKLQEALENLLLDFYQNFIGQIEGKAYFKSLNLFLAKLDYVVTNAKVALKYKYYRPNIKLAEKPYLEILELRHPLIERIIQNKYIPNNISLGKEVDGILMYGINSSGKSSLTKSIGLAVIMAQCGMFVPGKMTYHPYSKIITRLSGNDDIKKGHSSFIVEMMELRTIIRSADESTLVFGDELCRGTESVSGQSLTIATLEELSKRKSSYIFSTHMHDLVNQTKIKSLVEMKKIRICHLGTYYHEGLDKLVYERTLKEGSGLSVYGLEVCKSLGFPPSFIEEAQEIQNKLLGSEKVVSTKKSKYNSKVFVDKCSLCGSFFDLATHHLAEQSTADERGFIEHYHKNSNFNLLVLCQTCHKKLHADQYKFKALDTLNGTYLEKKSPVYMDAN